MEDVLVGKLRRRLEGYPWPKDKILVSNIGPDIGYGCDKNRPALINHCFRWVAQHEYALGIRKRIP